MVSDFGAGETQSLFACSQPGYLQDDASAQQHMRASLATFDVVEGFCDFVAARLFKRRLNYPAILLVLTVPVDYTLSQRTLYADLMRRSMCNKIKDVQLRVEILNEPTAGENAVLMCAAPRGVSCWSRRQSYHSPRWARSLRVLLRPLQEGAS
jgi:hypothetical protein